MSVSRQDFIRTLVATSATAGSVLSIVPRQADALSFNGLGSLAHKSILLVQRVFAARQASLTGQTLPIASQGALDNALQRATQISKLLPYLSGNQDAAITDHNLNSATFEINNRLPTILNAAESFVTNSLGGSGVIAHMTDALSVAQTTTLSYGDLEGGLLSEAFVALADLRDNLGTSPNRTSQRVHAFAIRTDSAIYSLLASGAPTPAPMTSGADKAAYGTPHTIGLAGKGLGAFFASNGSANSGVENTAQLLQELAPKIATALVPFAAPVSIFISLVDAITHHHRQTPSPTATPTAAPSSSTTNIVPGNGLLQQASQFILDADSVVAEIEGGGVAQIATTFSMLRQCARSVRNGVMLPPPHCVVDADGVYVCAPRISTKIAVLAAREDGPGYKFLSAHGRGCN